ncbi:MAG: MmgE/PrpD family protein [Pseudomonadales bacterium]|nr:MmgE/PrpD family protein [Pseudomonadales bacterium]
MTEPGITRRVAEFISGSGEAAWPEETLELGRRHLLDTIASIVVCGDRPSANLARRFALDQSATEQGGAPILGSHERASLVDAVFASAMTAHGAEINDFCPSAFVQPGPSIASAVLCVADMDHARGSRVLRALICGYELACRLPKALGIDRGRFLGYSSHGYGPVFGTAAAVASLRSFSELQVNHMLSYCAQQVSGSMQWLLDAEHIEKSFVFAGMPARNGMHAALLAGAGMTGVVDCLDIKGGWFSSRQFSAEQTDYDPAYLVDDLGVRFEMPLVAYKRFPVGGPTQPVVQAMLELVPNVGGREVASVEIEMPGSVGAFANAEMPALNLPYLCSIILIDGRLDFEMADSMSRKQTDKSVGALMQKVSVKHDPKQEAVPRKESARVTIRFVDGSMETTFVEHVRGYPPNPMSREDVEDKARELITPVLGQARTDTLVDMVWHIEDLANAGELAVAMARR